MTRVTWLLAFLMAGLCLGAQLPHKSEAQIPNANRLVYLDESDPFYPGRYFPKLITPQWIGESNVEAVIILAIDDMNGPERWENFLRPILDRLKQIDGRAPVSIMTVSIDPQHRQLQKWLAEGLSLEVHTLTHPCPLLAQGDFKASEATYHKCIEMMNRIPGNHPVAFRMPCCDSMDSASPRFYAEIFNRTNASGQFLTIDSSVMNIITTNDSVLPRELTLDSEGRERFRKYVPFPAFSTTIEDYPYPYVIGKLCWEFPGVVPSDWEAQHLQGTNNPLTVADWKVALDATVIKQGTMNMIFHPHGWISNAQIVELIDYAVQKYGNKVKFLTFREAQDRIDKNLLLGQPLRGVNGEDNGVRLLDLNNDGYLDVIVGNERATQTRLWHPESRSWTSSGFPTPLVASNPAGERYETGVRFGIFRPDGMVTAMVRNGRESKAWTFGQAEWAEDDCLAGLDLDGKPVLTASVDEGQVLRDRGVRFRDVDGDGQDELIVGNEAQNAVFNWSEKQHSWSRLPYALPEHASIVDSEGRDNGLRVVDVNEDGLADVIFSNEKYFALNLFIAKPYLGFETGWSREVLSGRRGELGEIPMITRTGSNNGAWFRSRELWVQNETTAALPDKVDRRAFNTLLMGIQPPALSPEDSLKAIRVHPGFKVELVAHEPLVQDPIAFEWGADGKLWVVEMGDYPLGTDGQGKPGGIVRFLEDTNHDGIYDKSTVFLDGLNFPTGVIPWGRGVIVSAAPDIFYAEDTDGDGKADLRKVLYTGFNEGNQQHRLNGFDYGLDNWLYGANGDSGGHIRPREREGFRLVSPVDISGRDFRFRPGDGSFEAQAGETQFGRRRDDWGNWFGNNNSAWLWHYFLPEHYVARNPHLAIETNKRLLANYDKSARVFPVCRPQQRFNDIGTASQVTSANSATPYRDELFGPEFATSVFISEPVYNLVHREVLEAQGVSFSSHRAAEEIESEFLASTDNWFRPTMLKTGPDGALYFADMYRFVIEHPEWIPEDVKHRLDLRAGHDQGRIYRVYPAKSKLRPIPGLDQLDIAGLVAALDSPNGWQRDTAQRLLIERGDPRAKKLLEKLIKTSARPKTRLQTLCVLDGLGGVTPDLLIGALKDSHSAVRENAIRISEPWLKTTDSKDPAAVSRSSLNQLGELLLKLADDPAVRVRYQLGFTLGEWDDARAAQALVKLAVKDGDNAEMQVAVMSSAAPHLSAMLKMVLKTGSENNPPSGQLLDKLFGLAANAGDEGSFELALKAVGKSNSGVYASWQFSALAGALDSLDREGKSLRKLQAGAGPGLKSAIQDLDGIFAAARLAKAPTDSDVSTLMPLRLLGRGLTETESDIKRLGKLLEPGCPVAIQQAAVDSLRHLREPLVGEVLLRNWNGSSPSIRPLILQALLSRRAWIDQLLAALEAGTIPVTHISAVEKQKLMKHGQAAIRERAMKLFAVTSSDRQKIVKSYEAVLGLPGDQSRGAILFQQNCAACHQFPAHPEIGPDLGPVANKPIETLIESILDPNSAVEVRYVNYTALTKDEREISGIIVAEGANSITLRSPTGGETVLRKDLQRLTSSGLSLMPEGFEKVLTPQDLADVIAYIRKK